ncbi:diaminopropionate ammonia-lyase [Desulforamulus ferrireducens]|uniref:Diaminopropionate ammonia-lyase n=1 Tax=Desulforamulus ferrireducens TaxID=1833852 RepID=A0A1S6IVX6_9FIRM|nr:diaminopropionate ammonia-lyase [Desulforamulus ferrireducens]AQS58922.1 diaminopropionate ammonia-lyase [Desulforamulus ferrireducens]
MDQIKWQANEMLGKEKVSLDFFSQREIQKVRQFHQSFPEYSITPLRSLANLAKYLGVAGIYVKDESYRFGLNAFKVLGASFAMGKYLAQKLGKDIGEMDYHTLTSEETSRALGEITFATTTDGNHGRGVAWTANRLKQKSVVYMPKGTSQIRLANIRAEGAEASIVDMNYDDAVRMTAAKAQKYGWVIVQDTAWEGYEEIPTWIMQGYGTMAAEALEQLRQLQVERPTHVFVQAGVGTLAGAVQGYFASVFGKDCPKTVIVEADKADCHYKSAVAKDGKPRTVSGDLDTIMAGLACGEPNIISWRILRDYSEMFFSCPDWLAAKGMRLLGNPLGDDLRVISGESGAVTAGLLFELLTSKDLAEAKAKLGLNKDSQILLFSTEGDTDPEHYRSVVWDGRYPSYR